MNGGTLRLNQKSYRLRKRRLTECRDVTILLPVNRRTAKTINGVVTLHVPRVSLIRRRHRNALWRLAAIISHSTLPWWWNAHFTLSIGSSLHAGGLEVGGSGFVFWHFPIMVDLAPGEVLDLTDGNLIHGTVPLVGRFCVLGRGRLLVMG